MKENGLLKEAWFIDGLRQGLARSIRDGRITFIGECFNDKPYRGKQEYESGAQYDGDWKEGKYHGRGDIFTIIYTIIGI